MKRFMQLLVLLLAIPALAACAGAAAKPQAVALEARNLKFQPNVLEVMVGQPVSLTFTNNDTVEHDFSIMEIPVVTSATAEPMAGHDMEGMTMDPQLHMAAGAGATAMMEFVPSKPGTYEYFCTVPGHKESGMTGTLIVQAADIGS